MREYLGLFVSRADYAVQRFDGIGIVDRSAYLERNKVLRLSQWLRHDVDRFAMNIIISWGISLFVTWELHGILTRTPIPERIISSRTNHHDKT